MPTEDDDKESNRDEEQDDASALPSIAVGSTDDASAAAPADPTVPRNRAERRAAAKAARRGQSWQQAGAPTGAAVPAADEEALATEAARRPRVPPRTMSKGTGDVEGVPEWMRRAGDYLAQNRVNFLGGIVLAVAAVGGVTWWQRSVEAKGAAAAASYATALESYLAPVVPAGAPEPENAPPRTGPTYHTFDERARASNDRFHRTVQSHGASRVAALARLSEASSLYQLGRYQDAKRIYLSLMGADVSGLEARVLEGLAFTHESLNDLDQAALLYRQLEDTSGGAFRDQAQYYRARLLSRRGDDAGAKGILRTLIQRTTNITSTEASAIATSELREQALALLRDIDPADPLVVRAREQGEGAGAGGMQGLPPEILQMLRQQRQQQGQPGR